MSDTSFLGEMRDGAWLDAQVFDPIDYAVPDIIPEGLSILVGPPKVGKSWLVGGVGLGCAAGGLVFGRVKVTKRPVLYLALEDGHRRLQSRFRHLMMGDGIPVGIHVITQAVSSAVIPTITEFCQLNSGDRPMVIVDTLGRARPPRPAGSDAYQWDYAVGAQLKACIDSFPGSSLLVVHHSRKQESADFVDSVSGTAGVAGAADAVLVLSRDRHSDQAVLAVTGRDVPESEFAIHCDEGIWLLDGDDLAASQRAARTRRESKGLGDRALEVLALVNRRKETRAADLQEIGIDQDQARVYLKRLADAGRIGKSGRGIYTPTVISVTSVTDSEAGLLGEDP
ncbi:AAA family ATPase [Mycolicibacterium sp.]|uniref:AAA family ATPase n=1 Tax=Mycolicibacterium sp. TaxID=2320850 RepID=UPI0037C76EFD